MLCLNFCVDGRFIPAATPAGTCAVRCSLQWTVIGHDTARSHSGFSWPFLGPASLAGNCNCPDIGCIEPGQFCVPASLFRSSKHIVGRRFPFTQGLLLFQRRHIHDAWIWRLPARTCGPATGRVSGIEWLCLSGTWNRVGCQWLQSTRLQSGRSRNQRIDDLNCQQGNTDHGQYRSPLHTTLHLWRKVVLLPVLPGKKAVFCWLLWHGGEVDIQTGWLSPVIPT